MVEVATARIGSIPSRQTADDQTERMRIARIGAGRRCRNRGVDIVQLLAKEYSLPTRPPLAAAGRVKEPRLSGRLFGRDRR